MPYKCDTLTYTVYYCTATASERTSVQFEIRLPNRKDINDMVQFPIPHIQNFPELHSPAHRSTMQCLTTTTTTTTNVLTRAADTGCTVTRRAGGVAVLDDDEKKKKKRRDSLRWHPRRMKLTRRFMHSSGANINVKTRATEDDAAVDDIAEAMAAARACEDGGLSPGAGLKDADAQAEAAFADMINTTVDVTGENLSSEDLNELAKGGRMDNESTSKKSGGVLDDIKDLFGALSKGAHIVKQKGGRV